MRAIIISETTFALVRDQLVRDLVNSLQLRDKMLKTDPNWPSPGPAEPPFQHTVNYHVTKAFDQLLSG
jgi:hypothetical protein